MATFCTKCGAGLAPGAQFCAKCGAPVGLPAASAPPGQQPAYGQVYGQPAASPIQPAASGTSAVKIILIVVAVVVGLGLLSAMAFTFSMWRLSRAVHLNSRADGVTLSTRDGTISAGSTPAVSAADLGVPIYPGATRREGGMQINSASGSMVTAVFSTPDPVSKVVDFYRDKVGTNSSVIQTSTGAVISAGEDNKQGVVITVGSDSDNGGTSIGIMRTAKK